MKLADAQARFHALVTARDEVATIVAGDDDARAAVETMVVGDETLSAIDRLNGKPLLGRVLTINAATPRPPRDTGVYPPSA